VVSNSNIEIQRFQNRYPKIIVNAPCYVTNDTLDDDLNVPYARDEIKRLSQRHADRMEERSNILATNLVKEVETTRRLKRQLKTCIPDRIVTYRAYV